VTRAAADEQNIGPEVKWALFNRAVLDFADRRRGTTADRSLLESAGLDSGARTATGRAIALSRQLRQAPRMLPPNAAVQLADRLAARRAAVIALNSRQGLALIGASTPAVPGDDREVAGQVTSPGAARMAAIRDGMHRGHGPHPQTH
jgi:hypothetical protein